METYDYIIVGAGSAGGPVAARLSEDPAATIMLLEAGKDYPSEAATPADLLYSRNLAGMAHDWNYTAAPTPERTMPYRRGRVTGGTSAVNAAGALWPRPADFAEWVSLGNDAWGWEQVEPWLRRIESDADAPDAMLHGTEGPLPIRRYPPAELIPLQQAFAQVCQDALGLSVAQDHNDVRNSAGGVGPWPMNRRSDSTRVSTALAYLLPARGRRNLTIRGDANVARLTLEAGRAVGVELADGDALRARKGVVLCAGALGTPAILMRTGIGPAEHLISHGIEPIFDAPGVGARLWDHASVPVRLLPKPGQSDPLRDPRFQVLARIEAREGPPLALVPISFLDISASPALLAEAGAPVVALISAALMRPSGHGRVLLNDADPQSPPQIDLGLCRHPEDLRALRDGLRLAWRIVRHPRFAQEIQRVVGLDDATIQSDQQLDAYVRANVGSFNHPCGTAPMGPKDDPWAVTDQHGRVRGIDSLWIADASLMPRGVSVPPNLTAILIGERIAAWIGANEVAGHFS